MEDLCKNYRELEEIIESIDKDGSGQVEFSEFMMILKGHKKAYSRPEPNQKFIQTEFKDIMRGTHKEINTGEDISLNFVLRNYKRKIILSTPSDNSSITADHAKNIGTNRQSKYRDIVQRFQNFLHD